MKDQNFESLRVDKCIGYFVERRYGLKITSASLPLANNKTLNNPLRHWNRIFNDILEPPQQDSKWNLKGYKFLVVTFLLGIIRWKYPLSIPDTYLVYVPIFHAHARLSVSNFCCPGQLFTAYLLSFLSGSMQSVCVRITVGKTVLTIVNFRF